ncbi:MAG: hypothetical protein SH850_22595 [Planctomycetaceae bacterium]|nr:hypothetical protein [Planctomycetaceae bacterium]
MTADYEPSCCPTCGRAFTTFRDFPLLEIVGFERLPIPETIDSVSAEAATRRMARLRADPASLVSGREDGINMTPAIAQATETAEVTEYLDRLRALAGTTVVPTDLLPPLKAHGMFAWAYLIPGTELCLGIDDDESSGPIERIAEVQLYCAGPNLGSAGGPTLQPLGAIARIHYRGLLNVAASSPRP